MSSTPSPEDECAQQLLKTLQVTGAPVSSPSPPSPHARACRLPAPSLLGSTTLASGDATSRIMRCCFLTFSLRRYSRARGHDVNKALSMLNATIAWRQDFKPEAITASDVLMMGCTGKIYVQGQDRQGRPIIVMRPGASAARLSPAASAFPLVFTTFRQGTRIPPAIPTTSRTWPTHSNVPAP